MSDLAAELKKCTVKPLEIYDGERGMVILCKLRRKIDSLVLKHNQLVEITIKELTSRDRGSRETERTRSKSDEKAMPSGELVSTTISSPPSEPKPASFDELRTKWCHCVIPNRMRSQETCSECGLPMYEELKEEGHD